MTTTPSFHIKRGKKTSGYVLLITMALASAGAVVLAIALDWSSKNAVLTSRNNEYFTTCYAAEAATEKIFALVSKDYQNYGESLVYSKMATYASGVPSTIDNPSDSAYWNRYSFSDGRGTNNKVFLNRVATNKNIVLGPPYGGLYALAATYQIVANAKNVASDYQISGAVGQEINVGTIPLFQFAIFYQEDMEVNPGAPMNIRGLVHGNANIYSKSSGGVVFSNDVSASGSIIIDKKPGDPLDRSGGSAPNFREYHLSETSPLNLPVGTNTTEIVDDIGDNVHAILEVPPSGESPTSAAGTNRLYNQADLVLLVSNNIVIAKTGIRIDDPPVTIPQNQWSLFLKTNDTFFNKRENINIQSASIDVNQLRLWAFTNTATFDNRQLQSVYIVDLRPTSNAVVSTNYTVTTNYVVITNTTPQTALTYPATNTYIGVVNNTSVSTNSAATNKPSVPPAFNLVTNKAVVTTVAKPAAGTYVGTLKTNTTQINNSTTHPVTASPTIPYVPPITTNGSSPKKYTYKRIDNYTYTNITSYSFSLPAYAYNKITGISTNTVRMTNYFYSTNYNIFAESGIVLTNGSRLPSSGLTVATPNPLYVMGHYNTTTNGTAFSYGSTTAQTRPAALMADAITVLSSAWNPANSWGDYSSRTAANTTVNAAFLAGIVPTGNGYYSGGVENFPRFLENWSGRTFTYNGSMTVLFDSRVACAPWIDPGSANGIYGAPTRSWAFDNNFLDSTKLPPLTPSVLSVTKGKWSLIKPNTTTF